MDLPWGEPAVATAVARARLAAAKLQHEVSRAVRGRLRSAKRTQAWLAREVGWSPERLSRALNGSTPLALDDLLVLVEAAEVSLSVLARNALTPDEAMPANLDYLLWYLDRQREQVAERIAGTAPVRPSM